MKSFVKIAVCAAVAISVGCAGGDDNNAVNNTVVITPNNTTNPNNMTTNVDPNNETTNVDPNNAETCGNGTLDPMEECDSAIPAGEAGACPTSCTAGDACVASELVGSADDCTARCNNTMQTACVNDDGCCPPPCSSADDNDCGATCGNGVVEDGEICDGDCPASCDDADFCTTDTLTGSAATCDAQCTNEAITACVDGDNCCPNGCDASNDAECGSTCGNGMVEGGETCDGNCPASCDDGNACTTDAMTGSDATCNVACQNTPIMACTDGDGCCPANCNVSNDDDCSVSCGNGVVEMGETCDGNCPSSCDDGNACTTDSLTGSAGNCNVTCQNTSIVMCVDGDGCCPANCNADTDSDCSGTCGDGTVDPGETCDGNCPATCDDGDACTIDSSTGSEANCNVQCNTTAITACVDDDGCCAPGCLASNDNDCAQNQPIGGACATSGDCESGACFGDPVTGGYCTDLCIDDTDCPTDSHCGFIGDQGFGVCLQDCVDDNSCRAGGDYACYDADEAGTDECWPVGSGAGAPGDACDTYADCAGGQDGYCVDDSRGWQNGYCAQTCTAASGCPAGSHCGLFDTNTGQGICLDDCTGDADCRADGYLCYDLDNDAVDECAAAATGPGDIGDPCTEAYECGGGVDGACFTQGGDGFRQGYCTAFCDSATPCPTGSHCGIQDADGNGVCLADCAGNGECRLDGYLCLDPDGDATDECWPAATGTGQVGEACSGYWECVGGEYGACIIGSEWPDGYCTILCGTDEGSCTADSVCEDTTEVCLDSCASDADCRADYICDVDVLPSDACLPL